MILRYPYLPNLVARVMTSAFRASSSSRTLERGVGWIVAEREHGRPFVQRLPGEPVECALRTGGDEKGLEVSLCCLFEDQLVQGEV